ncbi:hypothetical protein BC826DRAFT_1021223, partial [Russula brevipes]
MRKVELPTQMSDKSDVIVEKSDHILTVYRPKDPDNKEFIAKKVQEKSAELTLLKAVEHKNIIRLIDSFDGWAILPKMIS